MIQIKRIQQTVQAPRKNARPAKTVNMQMVPTKMFPTNQPPTLLRVQPEMQCAPMRGSMYPMHIPKLHRTMEKSFPPPYPFILRSAQNADAPMYPAVRQTQWSNIQMNPIHISRNGKHRMLCVSPEIILIMLPESKKPAKAFHFCRLIFSINPFLFSWRTISLHLPPAYPGLCTV